MSCCNGNLFRSGYESSSSSSTSTSTGVTTLNGLTDVTATSSADKEVLSYNGSLSRWVNVPTWQALHGGELNSIVVGENSTTDGSSATVIGANSNGNTSSSVLGESNTIDGASCSVVGTANDLSVNATATVAIGTGNVGDHFGCVLLGQQATSDSSAQLVIQLDNGSGNPNTLKTKLESSTEASNDVMEVTLGSTGYNIPLSSTFGDGSEAEPSITFGSDLDTGIYAPLNNTLGITTAGVQRISVNGTSTIVYTPLIVDDKITVTTGNAIQHTDATDGQILIADAVGNFTPQDTDALGLANTASNVGGGSEWFKQKTGTDLEFRTMTASAPLTIFDNGDSFELLLDPGDISHTDLSDIGTNSHAQIDSHIAASAAHGVSGDVVGTSDTQTLTNKDLSSSTNVRTFPDGSAAAPSITFTDDVDTGIYAPLNNTLGITTAGVQRISVNGTSTIVYTPLIVDDKITVTTGNAIQHTDATDGQILVSDALGNFTPQDPASGGETNTASSVGTGEEVFKQKTGVDFEFRSLTSDSSITLTDNANDIGISIGTVNATSIADGSVTNTEFQYINTLTSNAQTQLNAKAAASHNHAASDITSGTLTVGQGGTGQTTLTAGNILRGNGTSGISHSLVPPTGDLVGTSDTQTLTNKDLSSSTNVRTFPDGSAAAPSIAFTDDVDTGVYAPSNNTLGITTAGVQRVSVGGSGTIVYTPLTVDGKITVTTGNAIQHTDATVGQILIADAVGNFTPQDAPSSGETNTASNAGGGEGLFYQKTGSDLEFKSLTATTPMLLFDGGTSVDISMDPSEIDVSDLGDVTVSSPSNGQVLTYNGTNWVNSTPYSAPTQSYCQSYINSDVAITIATVNTYQNLLAASSLGDGGSTADWTIDGTNRRFIYTGTETTLFKIDVSVSIKAETAKEVRMCLGFNGVDQSRTVVIGRGDQDDDDVETLTTHAIFSFDEDDYIEVLATMTGDLVTPDGVILPKRMALVITRV
jgi:hypothetical protein